MAFLAAIVGWSLRNRVIVLFATAVFIVLGLRAAWQLPMDAVPDVTNVQVQVITSAPALSPVEVEQYVTIPVERSLAGVPSTTQVRSISKYGLSMVTVVFRDHTDIYRARQLVDERMTQIRDAVQPQYGKPEMAPITSALGEVFQFTLENRQLSPMQLEELMSWVIAPQLRTVPGVVEVNVFGGEERQYQVMLDPGRLQAAGISVAQVVEALQRSNANTGGGYLEFNREQFLLSARGLVSNPDDLRQVVVSATAQGAPITIATLGDVVFAPRLRRGAATKDGRRETVVGVPLMLMGENSRQVTAAIQAKLHAVQSSLPVGTQMVPFYDRLKLVQRTIATVGKNLIEGALLVILILLLLLGNWRAGLVVAATIPISLLFAVWVMNSWGLSGNLMSLGAIDFGLLVDGAVIIVDNSVRRLGERRQALGAALGTSERLQVIEAATVEVRSASVYGEAIIAIVYLPILALTGVEGKMFHPMATTVLLALLGAFICSLTLIPVLTSYFVHPGSDEREPWLLRQLHRAYLPSLRAVMRQRALTLSLAVAALAAATLLFTRLGAEFIPQLDEGELLVEARRLPGISLSESIATDLRLQRALRKVPEVAHTVSRIGSPKLAVDPMGIEASDIYLQLKDKDHWRHGLTQQRLADEIADVVENAVPEIGGAVSQPIQMRTNELLAGVRSDVALLLYGPDLEILRRLGDRAAATLRRIPGAADLRVEQVAGLRYLRIVPDRSRLARYGLTIEDLHQTVQTIAVGVPAGDVLEGERRFGIVVRLQQNYQGDLSTLASLPLKSLLGPVVPLGDVADLSFMTGPAQVSRENQSRRLTVEFNVRGRDMLSVVAAAQAGIGTALRMPTGYRAEWGGQFQHYSEAKSRLVVVVPLVLILIGFMLWLAFRSLRTALLIFLGVPFAAIGGVVALWLRGIPFSISAAVGFIALFGVAVLNGLVLVSFAQHLEQRGADCITAIRQAAELRLRPVLMTALVASLGFVPMALSTSPGAEVQRPLATVVIGGLITSTLLTMWVLPVVYALWGHGRSGAGDHRPESPTNIAG